MSRRQKCIIVLSYLVWTAPVVIVVVVSVIAHKGISIDQILDLTGFVFVLFIITAPHLFIISTILQLYARSNCKNLFAFLRFIKEYGDYNNKPVACSHTDPL